MKNIIVTGCNGQLGRAVNEYYKNAADISFVNTDVAELDITDIDAVMRLAREVRPYAIVNCAAHTAVDACESQYEKAFAINAIGARNLAIASRETGAKLVHISTDYVFDGKGTRPYVETDPTNPMGAYGSTKLAGEEFVKAFADRWFILRTAWLYGDGKNFVKTMLRLSESHDEVSVVEDQQGSPTSALELARAIHHFEPTENYGIFHATCEGATNWADFAEEIFARAGKKTKVRHVTSEEYARMNPASAKRPAYSILENYMMKLTGDYRMADWRDALDEYMKTLGY